MRGDENELTGFPELVGKTVIVTGASGFIGGALTAMLAKLFFETGNGRVVALCRNIPEGRTRLGKSHDNVEFVSWNMRDPVPHIAGADAIVHAAGTGDPSTYARSPFTTTQENVLGCANLLAFAGRSGIKSFVLVSSGEVYGCVPGEGRIREEDRGTIPTAHPRSCYPLAKIACESLSLAAGREYGTNTLIARLCHVYGPRAGTRDPRIAALFPRLAAMGEDIVLKSDGRQVRSFCYINDAVTGILSLLARGSAGGIYNVADEMAELSIRQFAEKIAAARGVRVRFTAPNESETIEFNPMPRAVFATDKLRALGWKARTELEHGIGLTLASL